MGGYMLRKAQQQAAAFPHGNPSLHVKRELEAELDRLVAVAHRRKLRPDEKREGDRIRKLLDETPWPKPVEQCPRCGVVLDDYTRDGERCRQCQWRLADEPCRTCGGFGKQPGEPQPDSFGNYTPCDACEGTGKRDF